MSHVKNPFVRGYEKLHVVRTLLITYDDDAPPLWRPWHSSQARRPDDRAVLSPCLFG
ncbi:MAG: ABC transporter substrate-binding protein, partial [Candidatus Accumulibacter sp.]|nr:ABC transporter substrate-binding protein [Accumulibacter sp.]